MCTHTSRQKRILLAAACQSSPSHETQDPISSKTLLTTMDSVVNTQVSSTLKKRTRKANWTVYLVRFYMEHIVLTKSDFKKLGSTKESKRVAWTAITRSINEESISLLTGHSTAVNGQKMVESFTLFYKYKTWHNYITIGILSFR